MKDVSDARVAYFDSSPPMSTYLVAFIVSNLGCTGSNMKLLNGSEVPVNICARPMYANNTKFALGIAVQVMEFYLDVFKIDYPLPKLGS